MNEHLTKKDSYCRICHCKIDKKPAEASKHKDRILELFSHNIDSDPPTCSKKICDNCRRKVVREPGVFRAEPCTIVDFPDHADENCRICNGKVLPQQQFSLVKINTRPVVTLKTLEAIAIKLGFVSLPQSKENNILLLAFMEVDQLNLTARATKVVQISSELAWTLSINGHNIPKSHEIYVTYPTLSKENMDDFFTYIKTCTTCTGNDDFQDIVDEKLLSISDFKGNDGKIRAYIENKYFCLLPIPSQNV